MPHTNPQSLIPNPQSFLLSGVPVSAEALVLARLLAGEIIPNAKPQTIVHIAVGDRQMDMLAQALGFFAPEAEILSFPAWDCMPYDRVSPSAPLMALRMHTLSMLAAGAGHGPRIVLTTANAVVRRLPPESVMRQVTFLLEAGHSISRDTLAHWLLSQGYRRSGKAMEPGEFALRGSIIDITPPSMQEGIRIDMFGDEIESIKPFDPLTQLTNGKLERVLLYPVSEVLLGEETVQRFRESYRDTFGAVAKDDPLYESISQGNSYPGMEHWLPLFYPKTDTIFDYCPDALVTMDAQAQDTIAERHESILDYYGARKEALKSATAKNSFAAGALYQPLPPDDAYLMEASWELKMSQQAHAVFTPFNSPSPLVGEGWVGGALPIENGRTPHLNPPPQGGRKSVIINYRQTMRFLPAQDGHTPFDQLKTVIDAAAGNRKSTLLACFSAGSRERLMTLLLERGFHCVKIEHWRDAKDLRGKTLGLAVLPMESGFETDNTVFLAEQDVLGERISRAAARKKPSDVFLAESANFAEGELVVHKEHGIGRFEGLVTLTVSGAAHDCLKLIYEGDDKLFLPVENIEMVSRFGLDEENAKLDKLGGASWQARKAKLKQRIKIAAEALLKTAAERQVRTAPAVDVPTGSYDDFCARFPFVETEDQARAIDEVLEDLHAGRPMDRLVCGDVGFGKTEVALRAAFVMSSPSPLEGDGVGGTLLTIESGSTLRPNPSPQGGRGFQVAVIAPTTLLARQHFRNFSERFKGFPVAIRQLSRMVPARQQKETRDDLAEGKVDIVIGTHALLSKQVKFRNLGLVVVDEEQHFGVGQKEKLKELKSDVHVLTLSATPIPRTLQMALTGVRSLSLIATPPVDRLAVRSFVMPFDPVVLREALLREQHRGGKIFLVTPRIKDIAELKTNIAALAPEVKIGVAHGQMTPAQLDGVMNDFYDGKFDVLLSTAIIESGLDIPAANTMIIHNSHLFGLSQLYQLRGRVGRGKTRAYAYFLLPPRRVLSKNATRRLEVMQTLDSLGAGFTLASHDMDIRGFGNLVGEEQSGHIREVGIELYQQMLEEAVTQLKATSGQRLATGEENTSRQPLTTDDWSPQINLGISVLIPETYVEDLQLRLGLYRRVAALDNDDAINSFAAELVDRFGPSPEEVQHLIAVLGIKLLCKRAGIERFDAGPKGAVITFHNNVFAKPEALLDYVAKRPRTLKVRGDQKLVFSHEWLNIENKMASVKKLASEIAALCGDDC